jgi:hypothetical protein
MRDDKTTHLALPLPHPGNTLEDDVLRLRAAFSAIDAAVGGHAVLDDATLAGSTAALSLTLTFRDPASGEETVVTRVFPIASAQQAGIMSPADVTAIANLLTAVESLSGRGIRYPVHLAGATITQSTLQAAYETASGQTGTVPDGATLVDLDSDITYTWFASTEEWKTRGSDTVSQATNTVLGVVKGAENTSGKVYVELDGSLSVIGWDALVTALTGKASTADLTALTTRVAALEGRIPVLGADDDETAQSLSEANPNTLYFSTGED